MISQDALIAGLKAIDMKAVSLIGTGAAALLLMLAVETWFDSSSVVEEEIRVAVATNFADAIKEIAAQFEKKTGHKVALAFGSTGKHYSQIRNGAPFDAFFAADLRRPELLERQGLAVAGSRFTYAVGKLVLWGPREGVVDANGKVLTEGGFRRLAIANPKLAPYGRAAKQVLRSRGLWDALQGRLLRGENIGQTLQFVHSGNAELGFVAYSQLKKPDGSITGSLWEVPPSLYRPIEQQAVLLRPGKAARAWMAFVKGRRSRAIIRAFGYDVP